MWGAMLDAVKLEHEWKDRFEDETVTGRLRHFLVHDSVRCSSSSSSKDFNDKRKREEAEDVEQGDGELSDYDVQRKINEMSEIEEKGEQQQQQQVAAAWGGGRRREGGKSRKGPLL
ncbi:hypothetical protein GUITHDRAFT_121144 [Guillardia theta CCMP2712]|uniref:Uncharacterized protein n=1 Tax=Guillardia theta (strain CCMP2712) TaxID=905079 RepID=L1I9Y8_GUITC|nr:hypothetical protein GUITHDRAFT_121144 [Guillardia theta CCMP2712]EKX32665.1 hypothetical protein GUITHDRAFT_121144 [Guillardia theta CCMP2712]|eukprot:XP_005819645.1 hypothetical protein GUITHDRAFT_121144 [Guillardia theta CCMP2712]